MKRLAAQRPRFGYRRIQVLMDREGYPMSFDRTYRLWRKAALQVPKKRPRRRLASQPRPRPATGFINPETGEPLDKSISQMSVENRLRTWVYQNQDYDPATFDIRANRGDLARASAILDVNSADLARFRERGGKLLLVQGWNDYPVRPTGIINYLKEVEAANGGAAPTREFVRLFMVPGMGHCGGGPGAHVFDYVSPLVAWVDEGTAPEELIGGRPDGAFTRRHCVFPSTARYTGGDVNDAASYRCMAPP